MPDAGPAELPSLESLSAKIDDLTALIKKYFLRAPTTHALIYPHIASPGSGEALRMGSVVNVVVHSNKPSFPLAVEVRTDSGAPLSCVDVVFPAGQSPGYATVTLPGAVGNYVLACIVKHDSANTNDTHRVAIETVP